MIILNIFFLFSLNGTRKKNESEKKRKAEMRAKNANDSKKIRAKIARLQKKLDSIEN